jgi:serine/threonine protein kinase
MTDCPDNDALRELIEGTLSPADETALTEHLGQCSGCQHRFDQMAGPDGFIDRVAHAVSERRERTVLDQALHQLAGDRHRDEPNTPEGPAGSNTLNSDGEAMSPELSPYGDVEKWFEADASTDSESSETVRRLHGYEIVDFIGRGGMGVVFRVRDPSLNRIVALKVLSPSQATNRQSRERFLREARSAASINHVHVATVHSVVDRADLPCLVMEYVDGESLHQRLQRESRLKLKDVVTISYQVAAGIEAAHEKGIVHRDLKPGNILLEAGRKTRVRLTDFGLARTVDDETLTQSGLLVGTPGYIAPELVHGHAADHRSDLFSFGCLLYVMATGQVPFPASSTTESLRRVTEDDPVPTRQLNPELPRWLSDLIARLLQKHPDDRPQSATEVKRELRRRYRELKNSSASGKAIVLDESQEPTAEIGEQPTKLLKRLAASPQFRSAGVGIAALAVCGLGLAVWFGTRPGPEPGDTQSSGTPTDEPPDTARDASVSPSLDPPTPLPAARPFVVRNDDGDEVRRYARLDRAIDHADDGSTLVIESNGPFDITGIEVGQDELTIEAAPGFVPVLRLKPDADDDIPDLFLSKKNSLVLRGLELRVDVGDRSAAVESEEGLCLIRTRKSKFRAEHCRFVVQTIGCCMICTEPTDVTFQHCELHVPRGPVISWRAGEDDRVGIENCVISAKWLARVHGSPDSTVSLQVHSSTVVADTGFVFELEPVDQSRRPRIRLSTERNVFACDNLCAMPDNAAPLQFARRVEWQGSHNIYAAPFVALKSSAGATDSLAIWTARKNVAEQGSVVTQVTFEKSRDELRATGLQLIPGSPQDFSLTHTTDLSSQPGDVLGAPVGGIGPESLRENGNGDDRGRNR